MNPYPNVWLKKGKEVSIKRRHHWIFSGAISKKEDGIKNGDLVRVTDQEGNFLAIGYYGDSSITVRIISFEEGRIDEGFWLKTLQRAYALRTGLGLVDNEETNVYRLVHGEGDLIPGLIIDFYNGTAVIQAHHIGIHRHLSSITGSLQAIYGPQLKAIYDKSSSTLHGGDNVSDGWVMGQPTSNLVSEYGHRFEIDWEKGQKTGFFIDQRENRRLLANYSTGKKVLNAFCYSGGFSVYALKAGAKEVHSVDISAAAIALADKNVSINDVVEGIHASKTADILDYIKNVANDFDVIVLDPPAFAKHIRSRHQAVQAYKRINAAAFRSIRPGGIVFTFSCSQVVDLNLFIHTVTASAMEAGRDIRILHQLTQPGDHPINIYHQETAYLKGLVLYVV